MDLQAEFLDILASHPDISYLSLIEQARVRGWNLDSMSAEEQAFAAQIPAWRALLMVNVSAERESRMCKGFPQILPTGKAYVSAPVLTAYQIQSLADLFTSHILSHGNAPLGLAPFLRRSHFDLERLLIDATRLVLSLIVSESEEAAHPYCRDTHVLLINRCLLRRTYASSATGHTIKNRNNQAWHQDSSLLFQSRPMLTIWIPLQDNSGALIPGIELANATVDKFLPTFGDGVDSLQDVFDDYGTLGFSTMIPSVRAGGCVAFNGLTFHRTYVNEFMTGFRDALLIRVSPASHSRHFSGDRSADLFFEP